jgi:hypothetical protein
MFRRARPVPMKSSSAAACSTSCRPWTSPGSTPVAPIFSTQISGSGGEVLSDASSATLFTGSLAVQFGGTTLPTEVDGRKFISSGAFDSGTTINFEVVAAGGAAHGIPQLVAAGGVVSGTTISAGRQTGFDAAAGTAVQDEGSQYGRGGGSTEVVSGGLALATTVLEEQITIAGGNAGGALVDVGRRSVGSGGSASG